MKTIIITIFLLVPYNLFCQIHSNFLNENYYTDENTSELFYYDVFNMASFLIEGQFCKDVEILSNYPIEVKRHLSKDCLFGFRIARNKEGGEMLYFRNKITLDTLKITYLQFENNAYMPAIFINNPMKLTSQCFSLKTDSLTSRIELSTYFNDDLKCEILQYDLTVFSKGEIVFSKKTINGSKLPKEIQKNLNSISNPKGGLLIENVKIRIGNTVVNKIEPTLINTCINS